MNLMAAANILSVSWCCREYGSSSKNSNSEKTCKEDLAQATLGDASGSRSSPPVLPCSSKVPRPVRHRVYEMSAVLPTSNQSPFSCAMRDSWRHESLTHVIRNCVFLETRVQASPVSAGGKVRNAVDARLILFILVFHSLDFSSKQSL